MKKALCHTPTSLVLIMNITVIIILPQVKHLFQMVEEIQRLPTWLYKGTQRTDRAWLPGPIQTPGYREQLWKKRQKHQRKLKSTKQKESTIEILNTLFFFRLLFSFPDQSVTPRKFMIS